MGLKGRIRKMVRIETGVKRGFAVKVDMHLKAGAREACRSLGAPNPPPLLPGRCWMVLQPQLHAFSKQFIKQKGRRHAFLIPII